MLQTVLWNIICAPSTQEVAGVHDTAAPALSFCKVKLWTPAMQEVAVAAMARFLVELWHGAAPTISRRQMQCTALLLQLWSCQMFWLC